MKNKIFGTTKQRSLVGLASVGVMLVGIALAADMTYARPEFYGGFWERISRYDFEDVPWQQPVEPPAPVAYAPSEPVAPVASVQVSNPDSNFAFQPQYDNYWDLNQGGPAAPAPAAQTPEEAQNEAAVQAVQDAIDADAAAAAQAAQDAQNEAAVAAVQAAIDADTAAAAPDSSTTQAQQDAQNEAAVASVQAAIDADTSVDAATPSEGSAPDAGPGPASVDGGTSTASNDAGPGEGGGDGDGGGDGGGATSQ